MSWSYQARSAVDLVSVELPVVLLLRGRRNPRRLISGLDPGKRDTFKWIFDRRSVEIRRVQLCDREWRLARCVYPSNRLMRASFDRRNDASAR